MNIEEGPVGKAHVRTSLAGYVFPVYFSHTRTQKFQKTNWLKFGSAIRVFISNLSGGHAQRASTNAADTSGALAD